MQACLQELSDQWKARVRLNPDDALSTLIGDFLPHAIRTMASYPWAAELKRPELARLAVMIIQDAHTHSIQDVEQTIMKDVRAHSDLQISGDPSNPALGLSARARRRRGIWLRGRR